MVGVLNGEKGKAVSVVVVAFLLCGVFGGLVAQPCLAVVGDSGYFGSVASSGGAYVQTATDTFYCSPFALNVDANVSRISGLGDWYNQNVKFFIYSVDGQTCYYGGDSVKVTGNVWLNDTGVSGLQLEAGTYLMGFRSSGTANYFYKVTGNGMNGTQSFTGAWGSLSYVNTNQLVSVYANYTEIDYEGGVLETSMGISSWGGLAVSVFLIAVCLVLALKSKSWAVNFLFGLGTVGFLGWVFANATVEVYGGWLMYMVLLSAVLALTKGAVLVRASGV